MTSSPHLPSLTLEEIRVGERDRRTPDIASHLAACSLCARRLAEPVGLALTVAERQRRRRSWQARLNDNALPDGAEVAVLIAGSRHALAALGITASEAPNSARLRAIG